MNEIREAKLARYVFKDAVSPVTPVRIITLADAAINACGAAVYAGVETKNGDFTCSLLLVKSKLVRGTVPRNEWEGVVLAAESTLSYSVHWVNRIGETRLYTDSRIAVCWVLNQEKRLRMWAFNRVQAVRNMIKQVKGDSETVPLYHIEGTNNIADLLTKERTVRYYDCSEDSTWQGGMLWMSFPTEELPSNHVHKSP